MADKRDVSAYGNVKPVRVIAEGDFACFTRPEFKAERLSYEVPTPGALEGMLKSVYWKPAMEYVIDKIVVYNPIDFVPIRKNELKDKVLYSKMKSQMEGRGSDPCISTTESHTQRMSTILKNVKYGIEFRILPTGIRDEREREQGINSAVKHREECIRRLSKGQHWRRPYFGRNEYPVRKLTLVDEFNEDEINYGIKMLRDFDLGFMSYRVEFEDHGQPIYGDGEWDKAYFSDNGLAQYYHPHLVNGVIDVAKYREEMGH